MTTRYVFRRVDMTDVAVIETVTKMHETVFTDGSPMCSVAGDWWLGYHKGKPVAFCGVAPALNTPNAAYLARAGVLPAHRGHGLQRKMIKLRVQRARELGFTLAVTDTQSNVYSANNLIEEGFRLFEPSYQWGYSGALYWRKPLTVLTKKKDEAPKVIAPTSS